MDNLKPIAFYLPQYYQTETNDLNWGEGYTEWTAVTRATPSYFNHYQPHLPDALGYYNLKMEEVIQKQINLARKYGVYGFCFYFYNFGNRIELRLPLDTFCNLDKNDFPFCLCWANENWTKRWDGKNKDVLISQQYDKLSLDNVIQDACKYMKHPNYLKIDGKPLFIVYNPAELHNISKFSDNLRFECNKVGIGDIHLSYVNKAFDESPYKFGFNSVTEFPPHGMLNLKRKNITKLLFHSGFRGEVFDIEDYVNNLQYEKTPYSVFRCAFPSWDNSARRRLTPQIFHGASPQLFAQWIKKICRYSVENLQDSDRVFFINAWNEWGEGAHLEPDKKYGYAYLQALRDVLNGEF